MNCDQRCDFAGNYELSSLPAVKAVERRVLGCDYGGTSWTTLDQVSHILASLGLGPETRLLEAGCGSGWPGLYLSRMSGCMATLLDVPRNALGQAGDRAAADGIRDRIQIVNASATAMPFDAAVFDCISHSDVLCCLPEKREMLAECRRVVRDAGRMHFSVIAPAPGLDGDDLAIARNTGPAFVDVDGPYDDLLRHTGWRVTERVDVSREYGDSLERLVAGFEADPDAMTEAFGAEEFAMAVARRKEQVGAVRSGLLVRNAFVAAAA